MVRRLVAEGGEVHALVHPESASWRLADLEGAALQRVDIRDLAGVTALLGRVQPEVVFHCAAHGAYAFERGVPDIVSTNVMGMANLLQAMATTGCKLVVNAGSSSEYGDVDHAPVEDEAPRPNSIYSCSKGAATWLGALAQEALGVRVVTLRLYSVYGPYEDPRRLMPTLCACALRGELPALADPWVVRDFVYVDDVIDAFLLAAMVDGPRIYNVGSGVETSLRGLAELVRDVFHITQAPVFGSYPNRAWDVRCWRADPAAIAADLGWASRVDLRDGLGRFAEWMRSRPEVYGVRL